MLRSKNLKRTEKPQEMGAHAEILQIPRSDVTLAALDILLENPMIPMNGMKLRRLVEKRLKRKVNYSGILKQVRSYAEKPYWNQVLVCQKQSVLRFYARRNRLARKLHNEIHMLYNLSHSLSAVICLKQELKDLKNMVLTDPLCNIKEVQNRIQMIEGKLNALLNP